MRVAFDGTVLAAGPITGVARAFLTTLRSHAEHSGSECLLLLPEGAEDPELPGVSPVTAPSGPLARQLELPGLLRRIGCDLLHSPVAAVPLRCPCPVVATAHDLPWMHSPSPQDWTWRQRMATSWSLARASAVLAPSDFTADAVRRMLGADGRDKVRLLPHGIDLPEVAAEVSARRGPLISLGDDRPRKNRERLREAMQRALQLDPDLPPLVFVGPPHNFVDECDKLRLLDECTAMLQLSSFEGFGLPVLEGLAHGAPVVCSDIPPHREIADGAALFVAPDSIENLAAAIIRICREASLRAYLAEAGRRRARSFDVATTAAAWHALHLELTT